MYILILNPASGRGAALLRLDEIEALLRERGFLYRIDRADGSAAATQLARAAAEEAPEGIIAIGGDGTLYEVVNGMAGSDVPLLIVSCGTGNDFVRMLNLPRDPVEALKRQLDCPISKIDIGRMNDRYFLNVSGTGFDVDVLRDTEKYKDKYTGLRAYLFGLHDAVKFYRPMTASVSIDGAPEGELSFAILSVGNGRYIGGGMRAVPNAIIDDGYFDVVVVKPVKKWQILPLIVFFITGKHVALGMGRVYRCKTLKLRCEGMTLNIDGELLRTDAARFELLPKALSVRIPKR